MKAVHILLILLLCMGLLSGCGTQEAQPTQTIPPASVTQTAPAFAGEAEIPEIPLLTQIQEETPGSLSQWVLTNYEFSTFWKDSLGNICAVEIRLPALNPVAEFAAAYNTTVYQLGQTALQEVRQCMEQKNSCSFSSLTYEAYMDDDIVSIVITQQSGDGTARYTIHSFDVEDRKALSTAELCDELLDMDYPSFLLTTNELVRHAFRSEYEKEVAASDTAVMTEEEKAALDYYNAVLDSISTNTVNMYSRQLYVGSNGTVMLLLPTLTMDNAPALPTGSKETLNAISLDSRHLSEIQSYADFFALMDKVDGACATSYACMLKDAFLADDEDFVRYTAKMNPNQLAEMAAMITDTASDREEIRLSAQCRELLNDEDITESGRILVNQILQAAE